MNNYSIYPKQFNTLEHKFLYDTCFVIMPFSDELNNTYMVIDSVAESLKIKCTRADNVSTTSEPILNKIFTQISQSYFIIVDITNLNPNVFYELGIAHVLRDANKVLIIKEDATRCPSDVSHIHYYEYNKTDLKSLKETIKKFFKENNLLEDLYSILEFCSLLSNNREQSQKFVNELTNCIIDSMECLIMILNNQLSDLQSNSVLTLLYSLSEKLNMMNESHELYLLFSNLILFIIQKVYNMYNILPFISKVCCGQYDSLTKEWIADCCIKVLDNNLYYEIVMSWIINYLKHVSPAEFDIAKYKLEIGIIKSTVEQIDTLLIKELNSSNKTLVEHCAKLIKERRTTKAIPILVDLLRQEDNPYVFRSSLDAIIKIAPLNMLLEAKKITDKRNQYVQSFGFLKKHIDDLNKQINAYI